MKKQLITLGALVGGFIIGASALVAVAQTASTWSAPHQTPSNCDPALDSGCNAPINVGGTPQWKTGLLGLGNFQFDPGGSDSINPGSVMVAMDNYGTVGWSNINCASGQVLQGIDPTGNPICVVLSAGAITTYNYTNTSTPYTTPNGRCSRVAAGYDNNGNTVSWKEVCSYTSTSTWQVPSGVTSVLVEVWGGGGGGGYKGSNAPSGGGAGTFTSKVYTVIPGQVFNVLVGSAGYGGEYGGATTCSSFYNSSQYITNTY